MASATFERSVFINCPFDDDYKPLLRPLLFTVLHLGLQPRLALGRYDSGEPRIQKIVELIRTSKFGIHDLSRCKARREGELFRLNMPLELGIDLGCKVFKGGKWRHKRCLILETEPYRFQAAISDLSNSDIAAHGDNPEELVRKVRNWLVQEAPVKPVSASAIWGSFLDFMAANYDRLIATGYTAAEIEALPIAELQTQMGDWLPRRSFASAKA